MAHQDISKYLENEGVATKLISAGKFKTEGNPYAPLPDDAQAYCHARQERFVDDVEIEFQIFTDSAKRALLPLALKGKT